jgi:outer membrane lipoprotein-sorting protein
MRTRPRPPRAEARRRLLGALAAGALALAARGAGASGFDMPALMALLARRRSGEARFTEERTVAALDAPLRASGRLSFQAPDRFARHTEQPRPESMEVLGNTVVLRRGTRTRQLTLDTVPELAALADALRGTLTGNAEVLQRHFDVKVAGSAERWTLTLTPKSAEPQGSIVGIEILGLRADVRSIDMALAGGDRSLMLIEPLKAAAP